MLKLRDYIVAIVLFSIAESYGFRYLAPQLRPTGRLGSLGFRLFLLNAFLGLLYRWFVWPFFQNPLRKIQGPHGGNFFIGHGMYQFSKPPGEKLRQMVNTIPNDGLLYFRGFFNRSVVLPTSHETLKAILSDRTYDYEKPASFVTLLRRVLGDGLILVEGSLHQFQRKHLMPSFQVKHIRELYPMFWAKSCELSDLIAAQFQHVQDAEELEIDFGHWSTRATLDIIGIAGFGRDFYALDNPDDELVKQYYTLLDPDNEKLLWFALQVIFPQSVISAMPWRINAEVKRIEKYLYHFAFNLVKQRRTAFEANQDLEMNDILSLLVKSNDFTNDELASQVLTMMGAGHETTSSALCWCTYLLSLDPRIRSQLRTEIRTHLPSPSSGHAGASITVAQIDALPLLNAVCNETLRLYPAVPVTIREAIRSTPVGEYMLPQGTFVLLAPWAINRSNSFWGQNAGHFKPERWINSDGTPNNTGGCKSNYALMTFLHGPRSCIGQGFARSELKCLLASIVGRYEFDLARSRETYLPSGMVTTKPENGMWLKMKLLEGW